MRLLANRKALLGLGACVAVGVPLAVWADARPNGPAADYPMLVGAPYQIGATTFAPADTLNYDVVGYAAVDGGAGFTAAHHTLPVPSYVEVTSLASGRTILVRVERRGPMEDAGHAIALSAAAASALALPADGHGAVRVRRVNPPEADRALLRAGQSAPERMATPPSLLEVLKRKLGPGSTVSLITSAPNGGLDAMGKPVGGAAAGNMAPPSPASAPIRAIAPAPQPLAPVPAPVAKPAPAAMPVAVKPISAPPAPKAAPIAKAPTPPKPTHGEIWFVQAGAFGVKTNAEAVAHKTGGEIVPLGKLWRVRVGPLPDRAAAELALAKVKSAGYSQARIQRGE